MLAALASVVALLGCDGLPTCEEAVGHYYEEGCSHYWADASDISVDPYEEDLRICHWLVQFSKDFGCDVVYHRILNCLGSTTAPCKECDHLSRQLWNCTTGPAETDCNNDLDDDDDGLIDCEDPNCACTSR